MLPPGRANTVRYRSARGILYPIVADHVARRHLERPGLYAFHLGYCVTL
jgi:hypothetical protein